MRGRFVSPILLLACNALALNAAARSAPPSAGPISTGNRLYELCRSDSPDCVAYIAGVADTASLMSARWGICIPPGTTIRQMILAFQNYASQNPSIMIAPAADLVLRGLQQNFPCKPISN